MKPQLISPAVSALFALLALIFLALSATGPSPSAKKTWRRIGVIFALVALVILVMLPR
jgi:hypothetical protein